MNDMIFSWAEDANGKMVHVDSVRQGLNCDCTCPYCHEQLMARHGDRRSHGFAHHSKKRGANLKICYMVIMYKLAEQIIQQEKKIKAPSYHGIFEDRNLEFSEVIINDRYSRIDRQPDVIATTTDGVQYLIEFTFFDKIHHQEDIDYNKLNCIEIDLSSQTLETLYDFLLDSNSSRIWRNNQTYFDNIESEYSKRGKLVKVIRETDCENCNLKNNCCGIKPTGEFLPIIVENNGISYRVCEIVEYNKLQQQIEEYNNHQKQIEEIRPQNEFFKRLRHIDRHKGQKKSDLIAPSEINLDQRTCFMCQSNLDWKCKNDHRYAHCGSYISLKVPANTPPDTAKTCSNFRPKFNNKAH